MTRYPPPNDVVIVDSVPCCCSTGVASADGDADANALVLDRVRPDRAEAGGAVLGRAGGGRRVGVRVLSCRDASPALPGAVGVFGLSNPK